MRWGKVTRKRCSDRLAGWAGALFARRHARSFAVLSTLAMLASAALLLSMALRLVT